MKRAVVRRSIVTKGSPNNTTNLNIDGRDINVRTNAFVSDPGLAREIEARHSVGRRGEVSKDVVVSHDVPVYVEEGHNYHFGSTRKFANAWDRIFGNKEQ